MRKFLQFTLSLLAMLMVTLNANAWKFTLDSPAAGEVESIPSIKLSFSGDGWLAEYSPMDVTLTGPNGSIACALGNFNPSYVETNFTFKEITEPGTYTLTVPANTFHQSKGYDPNTWEAIKGDGNDEFTVTWTIKDTNAGGGEQGGGEQGGGTTAEPWTFASVSPVEGEVESLGSFKFVYPALFSGWGTEGAGIENGGLDGTLTLPDGTTKDIKTMEDYNQENGELHLETMTAPGTYTITFAAGAGQSNGGVANAAMTYTWTIKGEDAPVASPYTLTYDKSGEFLKVVKDGVTNYGVTYMGGSSLEGYNGWFSFNPADSDGDWTNDCLGAYVALPNGDYILHVEAGTFTFDDVENEAFDIPFTVGGGSDIGGGTFEGEPYHETVFKAGDTTVDKNNIKFDTDGVTITAVDGTFVLGGSTTTIQFGYNTYDEKELDWNNNCQFVVVAKKDINKVIFVPTASGKKAIGNATADGGNGAYNNGVWEGKLAAGETLTLTSTDGTQIKEIYVCYNGDDFEPTSQEEEKGVITVQWPVENQAITQITDGGILAKFTTSKQYAHVTIELRNIVNSKYHSKYDLPMRFMDNVAPGEITCTASTPGTSSNGGNPAWIPYNGDAYELVVKGYVNYWDVANDDYDAMAVVPVHGESAKEHEPESDETLVKITPTTATELSMDVPKAQVTNLRDNTITFEFSGKISKFNATRCGSLMAGLDALKLVTRQIDADGKIWTVTIPKDDILNNFQPHEDYNFEITAYDAEGAVLLLNDYRADNALAVIYEVTDQDISEDDVKTLGTPAFSIEDGADNVPATTESILVTFPEAQGFGSNVVAKVSGTLTCRDMSTPVEFDDVEGTLANGVSVPVELANDKGYSFTITSVALSEVTKVEEETFVSPIGTYNGNWTTIFYVGEGQGGNTGDNILGEASIKAGKDGITVAWPDAQLSNIEGGAASFGEWTLTHNGQDYYIYPELTYDLQDGLTVEIPYTKIAVWDETIGEWGDYVPVELSAGDEITVSIPANEGVLIWEDYDNWGPMIYSNAEAISATVKVPSNEPAPTSEVLYEKGVNPEVPSSIEGDDARDLVIEGTDVTLAISNTATSPTGKYFNNAYINDSKGGIITTNTNVMKFTSSRTIEKIEFTANKTITQKNGTSCVGTLADNVWTGEASEISIAIGENVTNISKIVVYFKADSATGINNAASVNVANDKMYNLAGQQIKVAKGIVIKNGKKMFVK